MTFDSESQFLVAIEIFGVFLIFSSAIIYTFFASMCSCKQDKEDIEDPISDISDNDNDIDDLKQPLNPSINENENIESDNQVNQKTEKVD